MELSGLLSVSVEVVCRPTHSERQRSFQSQRSSGSEASCSATEVGAAVAGQRQFRSSSLNLSPMIGFH